MRLAAFRKLDALAPAYLTRRRSGDLVGVATHDVELIEYFFAHTITPALVAVLVPARGAGRARRRSAGRWCSCSCRSSLYAALVPGARARARIDRLGSRAREASGDLNAHVVDTVQGLGEIVAYGRVSAWGDALAVKARRFAELRLPFLHDLAVQTAFQEIATGFGGLAVIAVGAWLARRGTARRRRACRCSRCWRCRRSCRCGRSRRWAASSPTRWARRGDSTRSRPSRCR